MQLYKITPVPKPRMTRRDKHPPYRPRVARYYAFANRVALEKIDFPEAGAKIIFFLPMPKSWSKTMKARMNGEPHQKTPDKDNLEKALLDAIFGQDAHIWHT
jgi:Holliday junction resolvase RusA-like endonuclease